MTQFRARCIFWFTGSLGISGLACTAEPAPPPKPPIEAAEQLFAADLDGDGEAEIIAADDGTLFWGNHTYIYKGGIHASVTVDLDGDKVDELVLGLGRLAESAHS